MIIKNLDGAVIFDGTKLSGADLSGADLRGAYLCSADLSSADLSSADLRGALLYHADLRSADLRRAKLSGSDLSGTKLSGADLSGADLRGAYLSGAYLSGANLRGVKLDGLQIPRIDSLNRQILTQLNMGGELDMLSWHICETTHCRAGWIVYLAGDCGRALEAELGTNAAAALISAASGCPRVPDWYASDESALSDIRNLAARGL